MKKYTITITEVHLRLLSEITEKMARTIVGQLDYGILEECKAAIDRHYPELEFEDRHSMVEHTKNALAEIHQYCWKQQGNARYGVGYSAKSDTLWDIYEVLRHQLWQELKDKSIMTVDSDKPLHWNKKIPLIEIVKISDDE